MLTTLDWLVIGGAVAAVGAVSWYFFRVAPLAGVDARPAAPAAAPARDVGGPPPTGRASQEPTP